MTFRFTWLLLLLLAASFLRAAEEGFCPQCRSLVFKENKNQWHPNVRFLAETRTGQIYLEDRTFTYVVYDTLSLLRFAEAHHGKNIPPEARIFRAHALKMRLLNAATVQPAGEDQISEYFNYFLGNDRSRWASRVRGFHAVRYRQLYPNIDVQAYSSGGSFKYDFVVKPGGNIASIAMQYEGAEKMRVHQGALYLTTSVGEVMEAAPYAYQYVDGEKREVRCGFKLDGTTVRFLFPDGYDASRELTIDPTLIFSTYSGSTADNFGYTATYDSHGNAYAGGSVFQFFQYPVTAGALQTSWAGGIGYNIPGGLSATGTDMAITKYDSAGTVRLFSTYFGGNKDDLPHSMIVSSYDELLLFGTTGSTNFPVTPNAFDTTYNGGPDAGLFNGIAVHYQTGSDIVVARFSPDGTILLGSTYIGGNGIDGLNYPENQGLNYNYADEVRGEIEVDDNNNVIIGTCTNSSNFPTSINAYQHVYGGGQADGVLFKLNSTLSQLIWSTYLGGAQDDAIYSVAFDRNKDIYVCGGTRSANFPTTTGVIQPTLSGGRADGFITHLNKTADHVLHATYYGSNTYDQNYFVECNKQNQVYVLGQTFAQDSTFIRNSQYNRLRSGQFISKFTPALDSVEWSNVFGSGRGLPDISPTAFLVDLCNKIYVSGWGSDFRPFGSTYLTTKGLDITANAYQSTTDTNDFYVMVMEDDASLLNYATYFGNPVAEDHVDGGTSRFDRKGVIYQSVCAGCGGSSAFPTYPANTVSPTNNSYNCNNAIFKFDFNLPAIVADFFAPQSGCAPVNAQFVNNSRYFSTTQFSWDFGDSTYSNQINPLHTYTKPGLYTITLALFDPSSCNLRDTMQRQILILRSSKDTLPGIELCSPAAVQLGFPPLNDTAVHYRWTPNTYLSDTNISNPVSSADSTIRYALYASNGICIDTFYQSIRIFNAAFSLVKDTAICPGDTIHVTVIDAQHQVLTYQYNLQPYIISGDGTNSVALLPPTDTTLQITITDTNLCVQQFNVGLRVFNGRAVQAAFTLPNTGCAPVFGTLQNQSTGTTASTTYLWRFGDGTTSTQVNPTHTWNSAGNYTVTLIVRDNNQFCHPVDSVSQVMMVMQNNQLTVLPNDTMCFGQSNTIGGYPGVDTTATFIWTPNIHLSNNQILSPVANPDTSTTYTLTVTKNGCTFRYVQRIVVVNDRFYTLSDTATCPNDTLRITLDHDAWTLGYQYDWQPVGLFLSIDSNSALVRVPRDTTITITASNIYGCSYTTVLRLHAASERILDASFNAPSSGCMPFTATFTNTSQVINTTLTNWNFGDGFTSTQFSPSHTYARSGAYTVRLILTDPNSCNKRDTAFRTILLLDAHADSLPDKVICKNQSATIGIAGVTDTALHFLWRPAQTLSDSVIPNPVAAPSTSTTYQLFVSNGICTDTFTQRVRLFNDIFTLTQDTIPCPADTFHITATANSLFGVGFAWQPAPLIVRVTGGNRVTVRTPQDTAVFVTITSPLGCVVVDTFRAQVLDELSVRASFKVPLLACAPFTASFTNQSRVQNNPNYSWQFGDGGTSTDVNPVHTYADTGVYRISLVVVDNTAFCAKIDSVVQTIRIAQNNQTFLLPQLGVCKGDAVKIGSNLGTDSLAHYRWSPNYFLNNDTLPNPLASPPTDTTYLLTVTRENCTFFYRQPVEVWHDSVWITGLDASCVSNEVSLTAHHRDSAANTYQYQWSPTAYIVTGENAVTAVVRPPSGTQVAVQTTDQHGCILRDTTTVYTNANWSSLISATADPASIRFGNTSQLLATSTIPTTIFWQPDSTLSNPNIANPKAFPTQTHTYVVTFEDDRFCKKNDTVIVVVERTPCESSLFVPNAFSPNGDGKNDVFRVRGNDIETVDLKVFDRWGQLVFETKHISDGWDGNFKGAKLDPAVFGWIAAGRCSGGKAFEKKGNVTLLR
ncbi:MAG: PKD domain-containing protein [Chitinophagales bacterium]